MPEKVWTILDVLKWTSEHFAAVGIQSARLDAELLLAHTLRTGRLRLYMDFDRPLEAGELATYRALVHRRLTREPVAYLVGKREFYSLSFRVTPDVLIPRPDTELLVETAIHRFKAHPAPRVIDVGTGSGAIAVALARELPGVVVDAVDISEPALVIAQVNAEALGVADRVTCRRQDLLGDGAEGVYDLVVSNPPYIARSEWDGLMRDVKAYEPESALVADDDGLAVIARLARQAPAALKSGGVLLFEIGCDQAKRATALLADRAVWGEPTVLADLAGRDRAVLAVRT